MSTAGGEELLNQRRVDNRCSFDDSPEGVDEVVHIADAALQQVAAPLAACKEVRSLLHLDVRRQYEDRGLRHLIADHLGGVQSLARVGGRHPDVDDRELGAVLPHESEQLRRPAALAHDFESGALEQVRETLAEQNLIVRQHHPGAARGHALDYLRSSPCAWGRSEYGWLTMEPASRATSTRIEERLREAEETIETGRAARVDDYSKVEGHWAAVGREAGVRSAVGAPITGEGRLWGAVMAASTRAEPLALDTKDRLAEFAELAATAIANAEGRAELRAHTEEQAALRRVATLVARGVRPQDIFSAVSNEVRRLFRSNEAAVARFEPDGGAMVLVGVSSSTGVVSVGMRFRLEDFLAATAVYRTGRAARKEQSYENARGPLADRLREFGVLSTVAAPIVVEDDLWGVMSIADLDKRLPPDAEERLEKFTELVGTAIANAESRAELAASRARIVATADATRRRIERDLHDGAQQRLVSLALELRAVEEHVPPQLDALRAELSSVADGLTGVLDGLREIALGIHPALLAEGGLEPALRTLARRSTVPVELDVRAGGRLPEPVEVAAYYVVSEALTNAAKHAQASVVQVKVEAEDGVLRVSVRDDGVGGADPDQGSGLVGLKDRAEAIGGRISLASARGRGTALQVELPLAEHERWGPR